MSLYAWTRHISPVPTAMGYALAFGSVQFALMDVRVYVQSGISGIYALSFDAKVHHVSIQLCVASMVRFDLLNSYTKDSTSEILQPTHETIGSSHILCFHHDVENLRESLIISNVVDDMDWRYMYYCAGYLRVWG